MKLHNAFDARHFEAAIGGARLKVYRRGRLDRDMGGVSVSDVEVNAKMLFLFQFEIHVIAGLELVDCVVRRLAIIPFDSNAYFAARAAGMDVGRRIARAGKSEEHTSELQ